MGCAGNTSSASSAALSAIRRAPHEGQKPRPIPAVRYNVLLLQLRSILLFPLFVIWALSVRRSSPATHKRFMIIATVVILDAALGRSDWLPGPEARHASFESIAYSWHEANGWA
jgi:hypothetical protein